MNKKRWLCLALAMTLLSGCASQPGTTETSSEVATQPTEASVAAEATEAVEPVETAYTAGTYAGTSIGCNGQLTVLVTVSEDAIEKVEVTEHVETPTISDLAISRIPADIVAQQSLAVDGVSGASLTSLAIKRAVADAIDQAGATVTRYTRFQCHMRIWQWKIWIRRF